MNNYTTISVPDDVKKVLEKVKGDREWGEFLLELYREADRARRVRAFEKLVEVLSPEEVEILSESSRRFREGLRLR